jgi:hypothetical protein
VADKSAVLHTSHVTIAQGIFVLLFVSVITWASNRLIETYAFEREQGVAERSREQISDLRARLAQLEANPECARHAATR